MPVSDDDASRFWAKVDKDGPPPAHNLSLGSCWLWTACKRSGYGRFWLNERMHNAHRVAWEWANGPVSAGLELDHLCRTPQCVNPAHLEPVTHKENFSRGLGIDALKRGPALAAERHFTAVSCRRGHPFSGHNIYTAPNGNRTCNQCRREANKRRYWSKKEPK